MNNLPPVCPTPAPFQRPMTDEERDQHVLALLTEAQAAVANKKESKPTDAMLPGRKNMSSKEDNDAGLTATLVDLQERNGDSGGNALMQRRQKKRNKIVAWYLRWEEKREIKRLLKIVKTKTAALLREAPVLDVEIKALHTKTQELTESAKANPRPLMPPNRNDPGELFVRPADAPLSRYEELVKAHNEVVERYASTEAEIEKYWRRVTEFAKAVKGMNAANLGASERLAKLKQGNEAHGREKQPGQSGKFTKLDHDVEALDNAARNLGKDIEAVEGELKVARAVLKGTDA